MGAAWREVKDGPPFDRVLAMVRAIKAIGGLEVCCTLGMLDDDQARRLKEAGLDAYNHNLDTSPELYGRIITTRTYEDRLRTLAHVQKAGISVCCGGIIGMGEIRRRPDRHAARARQPARAARVGADQRPGGRRGHAAGRPAGGRDLGDGPDDRHGPHPLARAMVRLSAGRLEMTEPDQALCFLAGANSIFAGEKLLTTANPELRPRPPDVRAPRPPAAPGHGLTIGLPMTRPTRSPPTGRSASRPASRRRQRGRPRHQPRHRPWEHLAEPPGREGRRSRLATPAGRGLPPYAGYPLPDSDHRPV